MDCVFCKIVAGDIPAKKIYDDELTCAFFDLQPAAPTHVLVIPKKHIQSLAHLSPADGDIVGRLYTAVNKIAKDLELEQGFRTVVNTGDHGGQTIHHLHVHLLGGRPMHWPPG